jgi:hypothetical protein
MNYKIQLDIIGKRLLAVSIYLTIIIWIMYQSQNTYSDSLIIDCLNRLENTKNKVTFISKNTAEIEEELQASIKDLHFYLQTAKINRQLY